MVDRADPIGEGRYRLVVGDVDGLGGDARVVVGGGEAGRDAARHHDAGTLGAGQQRDGAGDPPAAHDHNHTVTLQRTHS